MSPSRCPSRIYAGGAFDPPHLGHLAVLTAVAKKFPSAHIDMVPPAHPVRASSINKQVEASFAQRLHMCELLIKESPLKNLGVSSIEAGLPAPNFTVHTVRSLREKFPGQELAWIIGQDQVEVFHEWREPKQILDICSLVVITRPGSSKSIEAATQDMLARLGLAFRYESSTFLLEKSCVYVMKEAVSGASSTSIRAGDLKHSKDLPDSIKRYIAEQGLYES